jgi:hypothetical protein
MDWGDMDWNDLQGMEEAYFEELAIKYEKVHRNSGSEFVDGIAEKVKDWKVICSVKITESEILSEDGMSGLVDIIRSVLSQSLEGGE